MFSLHVNPFFLQFQTSMVPCHVCDVHECHLGSASISCSNFVVCCWRVILAVALQTIEVLACMLAHRPRKPSKVFSIEQRIKALPKKSCICCNACGTYAANPNDPIAFSYQGEWVECSGCEAWMHSDCLNLPSGSPPDKLLCAGCMRDLALKEVPGVSKATLIVCPDAIFDQWLEEIGRHTEPGALRVDCYHGQRASLLSSHDGPPCPGHCLI
jgi:hypothetical protein